jgi:NADH-quinone oxidoreductase subunit H
MAEPVVTATAPIWSAVLLVAITLALAAVTSIADAALQARTAGRTLSAADLITPFREAARLLLVQPRTTRRPDVLLWRLGASSVLVVSLVGSIVVPLGRWAVADLSIGVVWWTAFLAMLWVAVWLTGWGPNAAQSLVAGYRFVAQALAYEMPLAITVVTCALAAGTLRVSGIAEAQQQLWYVVWQPLGAAVYLICALAIAFWGPFGHPVGRDLSGGVTAELAGVDRLVFAAGRWVALAAVSAFAVPLFLGGGAGPLLPDWLWSLLKTLLVLTVLVAARWRLPVVRVDRFEEFAWMVLLPVSLLQAFIVGVVVLVTKV